MDRNLPLAQFLSEDRVVLGLKADTYEAAVGCLIDQLADSDIISDREALDELVEAESASGEAPSMGDFALLAHYRTELVSDLAVVVGTSKRPFAFAPESVPEARILVLIVAPRAASRSYLQTLGSLSRILRDGKMAEAIAKARSASGLLAVSAIDQVSQRPELLVQDVMSSQVNAVPPDAPLSEVLEVMVKYGRRAVPVVSDSGEVLGLITENELLDHVLPALTAGSAAGERADALRDVTAREIMQRSVLCLSEDQSLADVAGIMQSKDVGRFPVVRDGKLVGFVSRTDIIRTMLEVVP